MSLAIPPVDDRNFDDIVSQALALANHYCPEWKAGEVEEVRETNAPGTALVYLFAHLMEIIITRLNRVPEKNFLAFLDFIGAKLRAPAPAEALLQFFLSEGAAIDCRVPAGTQIAAEESGNREEQIFETKNHLVVTPVNLVNAFTLEPGNDRYDDRTAMVTGTEEGEFRVFEAVNPVDHMLYLGDDRLFGFKETSAKVILKFTFTDKDSGFNGLKLSWEYSGGDRLWLPLSIDKEEPSNNTLEITINNPGDMKKDIVSGHEHYWIRVRLDEAAAKIDSLPEIETVTGSVYVTSSGVLPEACFTNQLPIDPPQSFYPFGPVPTHQHFFYIGSDEVFSKAGANISISLSFEKKGVQGSAESPALTWEYWNGRAWQPIDNIIDPTNHFTLDPGENKIEFVCPQIEQIEVNLQTRYWIRVRISSGNYGVEAHYDNGWVAGDLNPPRIRDITLGYEYNPDSTEIERIILKNNFSYMQPGPGSFLPFVPMEEKDPALYLGFDAPFSNDSIALFCQVAEGAESSRRIQWEYSSNNGWNRLSVKDETRDLSNRGHVRFIGPKDFSQTQYFGLTRYWLRLRLTASAGQFSPELGRVYLNTVWAENVETINDELLGSGDGSGAQTFKLKNFPVLPGQQVWAAAREMPPEEEIEKITREEGEDALSTTRDEDGNITEVRVRWHAVENFYGSGPGHRHYMIEPATGGITFGDGTRGKIPPLGSNNIICSRYRTGGGVQGNVEKGKIAELKTSLPFIDSVANVEPAAGGADAETLDEIMEHGPFMLKHRDRAVTTEDFEWLVQEAPGDIAVSKCFPVENGTYDNIVKVIIIPDSKDPKPEPGQNLIRQVENYLYERSLASLVSREVPRVQVTGPGYMKISTEAHMVPKNIDRAGYVEENVVTNLENFFHPLRGGPESKGWPFGRDVHFAEVMQVLQNTEGVDFVKSLRLNAVKDPEGDNDEPGTTEVEDKNPARIYLEPHYLVYSGTHTINMVLE
jgi:hypothetical protein